MKNKKKKRIDYFIIIIPILACSSILILILSAFWWADFCNTLTINNIVFSKSNILEEKYYKENLKDLSGTKIDKINLPHLTDLIEDHPYVRAARLSYRFPETIVIEIVERNPIAILNTHPMVMLDEDGYVLPNMNNIGNFSIPSLSNFNISPELYPIGEEVLSLKVKESIEWLSILKKDYRFLYDNLSEIRLVLNSEIELILADEPTKIILGNKDLWKKIEILKQFKRNLEPNKNLTDFSYLDMRYNNQVIAKDRPS